MLPSKILVVDDEAGIRDQLVRWLSREGYTVESVEKGHDALKAVKKSDFSVILLDLILPDLDGLEVLKKIHQNYPDICNIILTAYPSDELSTQARKLGAFDFLQKPIQFDLLSQRIDDAMQQFWRQQQAEYESEEKQLQFQFGNIIGNSPAMQDLFENIKRVANTNETVILLGESGTGKDLVAGAIHYNSPRRKHPLITVNCTTFTESLAESELFGHEKGAFTGADKRKIGKIQKAHLSSLFIDEIGELSPVLQTKFLEFLPYKTLQRVGGTEQISVDTRVITATNIDIEKAVHEKSFRQDLYYRLNRITIRLPPLRARVGDIPLLVAHFIKASNRRNGKNIEGISENALEELTRYPFPGNVRELENIIARAMLLESKSVIGTETIRACVTQHVETTEPDYRDFNFRESKKMFEKAYFFQIFEKFGRNISQAAAFAGLDRGHFRDKLKALGIKKDAG